MKINLRIARLFKAFLMISCCLSCLILQSGESPGQVSWSENPRLTKATSFRWVKLPDSTMSFGVLSEDGKSLFVAKGVTVAAGDIPGQGNMSGRILTVSIIDLRDQGIKIEETNWPVRYLHVAGDSYFAGFVAGRIFFRWKGVLLRREEGTIPEEALQNVLAVIENKGLANMLEIDMPRQFADNPASWRCFVREDEGTKPKSEEQ